VIAKAGLNYSILTSVPLNELRASQRAVAVAIDYINEEIDVLRLEALGIVGTANDVSA
jgi:hypothetical protein